MMATDRSPIRVVGRYALYNEIAAGGMATIHLGRLLGPVGFARTVAVKRLHPQFAKDPEFVSMFLDEARLAARVQHPNVVATIDVVATDGELFLIMDYVRGESLSKIVRTIRKQEELVPPRIAASIMCGFLHGLHAAHEAKNERAEPLGLVHRDVSPQNVLVGADGIARVLDFGIAKAAGRIQVTRDGQIKGKLAYMPPEQLSGRELSRAADIYASAVVMWETLTAERLFKGETEGETLAKILRDPVPPPSAIVPSIPRSFDAPLLRALSRDPSRRHATAKELALDLERCVGIASPTEVGEWVEGIVGQILNAREEQIAEIESNSVSLRLSGSGRPEPSSDSESDMLGLPSSPNGTLMGVGPASGTLPTAPSVRRPAPSMATAPTQQLARPQDEGTGSKSKMTGTLVVPVDKKLPLLATMAGLLVLLGIVGVVVAGKFSNETAKAAPRSSSSARPTLLAEPPPSVQITEAIPEPPSTSIEPAEPKPSTPRSTHAPRPTPAVRPGSAQPATPSTSAKKNCEPPWTVDAQGHRQYKRECL